MRARNDAGAGPWSYVARATPLAVEGPAQTSATISSQLPVEGLGQTPEMISGGYGHTCALTEDGTAACWGANTYGQAAPPRGPFTAPSSGDYHTCALRAHGTVECWGANQYGQATPLRGLFTALSSGAQHTCVLTHEGAVECWADGSARPSHTPERPLYRHVLVSLHITPKPASLND